MLYVEPVNDPHARYMHNSKENSKSLGGLSPHAGDVDAFRIIQKKIARG